MADTMTTRDDLTSTLQADEKKPDEAFSEFLLKLDSCHLDLKTMLGYNVSNEDFRSVMYRALGME